MEPLPDERHERLTPQVLSGLALLGEMLLDRILGRDTGMVVTGLEENVVSLHPARPHDRVRERELQRVAEVEVARHVRRRMRDREAFARIVGLGVVEAFRLPRLLPTLLDPVRVVQRLHQGIVVLPTSPVRGRRSGAIRQRLCAQYGCSAPPLARPKVSRSRRRFVAIRKVM